MDKFISGTHIPVAWLQPQETQTNEGANEPGTPSQITIVRIPSTKRYSSQNNPCSPKKDVKITCLGKPKLISTQSPTLTNPK